MHGLTTVCRSQPSNCRAQAGPALRRTLYDFKMDHWSPRAALPT